MSEHVESPLSEKQLARVEAIKAARDALQAVTPISRGSVDPMDLVSVARYIETGDDPWAHVVGTVEPNDPDVEVTNCA